MPLDGLEQGADPQDLDFRPEASDDLKADRQSPFAEAAIDAHRRMATVAMPAPLFSRMYADTMHMPKSEGYKFIVQGRCSLSGWPEFRKLSKENYKSIGDWIFEDILCRWGSLREIITDNGTPFIKALEYLAKQRGELLVLEPLLPGEVDVNGDAVEGREEGPGQVGDAQLEHHAAQQRGQPFHGHRREGEPCPTCSTLVRKMVVGGRGTYVCEHCQPRPRPRRA